MLWNAAWNVSSRYFLLILLQGIRTLCVEKLGVSGVEGWSELDDSLHPCWRLQSQWAGVRLHHKPAGSSGAVTWHQICDGGSCIFFSFGSGRRPRGLWIHPKKRSRAGDMSGSNRWGRMPAVRPTTCPCLDWNCMAPSLPSARTNWVQQPSCWSAWPPPGFKCIFSMSPQVKLWRRRRQTSVVSADSSVPRWWSTLSRGHGLSAALTGSGVTKMATLLERELWRERLTMVRRIRGSFKFKVYTCQVCFCPRCHEEFCDI